MPTLIQKQLEHKNQPLKEFKVTVYPKPKTYTIHSPDRGRVAALAEYEYQMGNHTDAEFYRHDITDIDEVNSWPVN